MACASSLPKGMWLRQWFYEHLAPPVVLLAAVAAVLVTPAGAAFLPEPVPPPEGCDEIPVQWRIWVIVICVAGFAVSALLLGLAK